MKRIYHYHVGQFDVHYIFKVSMRDISVVTEVFEFIEFEKLKLWMELNHPDWDYASTRTHEEIF